MEEGRGSDGTDAQHFVEGEELLQRQTIHVSASTPRIDGQATPENSDCLSPSLAFARPGDKPNQSTADWMGLVEVEVPVQDSEQRVELVCYRVHECQ